VTEKNIVTAIHDTLHEQMAADERMVVLGEDVGARGGVFRVTQGFLDEFGERRVIDTPLAEGAIVGLAVGMALHGLIPVAEIEFADFIHPAFDQIVSEVARMRYRTNGDFGLPMVIRTPWGGGVHGALYHSQSIEALFGHIPGLKVVVPSTPYDAAGMLRSAIADPDPVLFLEHKRTYRLISGEVPDEPYTVPIGPADVKREGKDVTIVSFGKMMKVALGAAEELQKEGISAEVIDLRTIRPFDVPTIVNSVKKTNRLVVVDECWPMASIASELAYRVQKDAFDYLDVPVVRINQADTPLPFSPPLIEASLPNVARVVAAVKEVMYVVK